MVIFTSKSNVLKFLKPKLKNSRIEEIFDFTVKNWINNKSKILDSIPLQFNSQFIIVRSSAKGEDSFESSKAGNYTSIQNVDSSSKLKLKTAIDKVINSYYDKGNSNTQNQILIQLQSTNIVTSGVIFTRSPKIGEPYYIINFEDGIFTNTVTGGLHSEMIKIFRMISIDKIPQKWKKLIKSIKEIEKITKNDWLDIEFGISKNNTIIIFQVRPLVKTIPIEIKNLDKRIKHVISKNKKYFLKLNSAKHVPGNKTIFSDMSDWNPSEIIGNNPNILDYSLYDYLVMRTTWHEGRTSIGYQNVDPYNLMIKFGNKPYVDIRGSFNSLIPNDIDKKLKEKLIKFYFKKLEDNPNLHDKVEFEILFTCYDFTLSDRLKELKKYGFTNVEIKKIDNSLIKFTNNIIDFFIKTSEKYNADIDLMLKNRILLFSNLNKTKQTPSDLFKTVEKLLVDCKYLGIINFSTVARLAFVSSMLLKSLKKINAIDSKQIDNFMQSIPTPVSEIQNDIKLYLKKQISKEKLVKKYGHLRPGTYDINAIRYDKNDKYFNNIKFLKTQKKINLNIEENILKKLPNNNLKFNNKVLLEFIKKSISQREKLKFEFTKNLSDSLELISKAGKKLGIKENELAYLDIDTILKNKNKNDLKNILKKKISTNLKIKKLNDYLILPPLIFSQNDFEVIKYYISKPNYITSKKITKNLIKLNNSDRKIQNIENSIVIIENADPGYDWIFSRNPAGLITKYGGVASHMAIRCSELGIPGAIGCGETLFEKLITSSKILLDCENEQIVILQSKIQDAFMEEKKILKSLGYIK
tara:strand:+ start:67 stop:2487 length:2421 start_codon:yes stop_codon:yes gene_type:complete